MGARSRHLMALAGGIVSSLVAFACVSDSTTDDTPWGATHDALVTQWGRAYDVRGGISVCFEDSSVEGERWEDVDDLNRAVQEAVEGEWGAKVGVRFHGWRSCREEPSAQVHVKFFDCPENAAECPDGNSRPHVKFIGPPGEGQAGPNFVYLRRTYEGHYRANQCNGRADFLSLPIPWKSVRESRAMCTRNYAVHEFGHILGFDHEQYHPKGDDCEKERYHYAESGKDAAVWLCSSGYDDQSVMNYCGKEFMNWGHGLSTKDISCAKEFFKLP